MKCYEIVIKPQSGFGTPLKGDTVFGHFCWQAQYDRNLLNGGLDRWIDIYPEKPFAVFSSAWPKLSVNKEMFYALRRPDLPLPYLFAGEGQDRRKRMEKRKDNAKRKWMLVGEDMRIDLKAAKYQDEGELVLLSFGALTDELKRTMRGKNKRKLVAEFTQTHNSINRSTMTTGEGMFAPYASNGHYYYPEMEMAVFVLFDEEATDIKKIGAAFERIGNHGFGRDASAGMGRFALGEIEEKTLPAIANANGCYTLAPCVPEKNAYRDYYFSPFTRFGRHGDALATSGKPFKNPVIMADEGAVFIPSGNASFAKPYLGRAVLNLSKIEPRTIAQGYAPYLPITMEVTP